MSRIVVTGGAGFVGSHLCEALLERGDAVVAVDNFSTSTIDNVEHLTERSDFELVVADVVQEIPVGGRVDGVLHLASPASPPEYLSMPLETLDVSSIGTRHALDLAHANDAPFLLASTSEIYGDPLVHPQPESYLGNVDPVGPRAVYDEAKRFAETLTMTYHRLYGLPTRIVRIFNTYGPRLRPADGRVVSNFLVQAIAGEPLTVYGEGTQTRSFCFVEDEVRGILALFDSQIVEPVNIGNPVEYTMLELAAVVCEVAGAKPDLVFETLPVGDPTRRQPDITRVQQLLGWEPKIELREGLERTHAWYLEERARGRA
ncbi:MAG: UDP-glucuronic acid decarboxylase family protein [Acidimicrobiia bacterium]